MSGHHISTLNTLLSVAGALFVLTIVTVGVHYLELPGPWSIIVAMLVASVKAGLVVLFFMNLYWDSKFHSFMFITSIVFLALLIGYSVLDIFFREVFTPSF